MGQIAVGRFYANRSLPTMIETKRLSPEVLEFRIPYSGVAISCDFAT